MEEMEEDTDGCFFMNPFRWISIGKQLLVWSFSLKMLSFRETKEYYGYQTFSFTIGILTIGKFWAQNIFY